MGKPIHMRRGHKGPPGSRPAPPQPNPSRASLPGGNQGGIGPGGKFGYLRDTRVSEATERAVKRANRTPAQQVEELDRRLGKGKGAVRERAKLARMTTAPADSGK